MKYHHIGIHTPDRFTGEIDLPHLKITVSDHANNPFGVQWQRYWEDAPYPELVKTVPHVDSRWRTWRRLWRVTRFSLRPIVPAWACSWPSLRSMERL
jgi:hypothetical protein